MDAPGLSLGPFSFPNTSKCHQPQDNISVYFEKRVRRGVMDQEGFSPIKWATLPPPGSNFVPH